MKASHKRGEKKKKKKITLKTLKYNHFPEYDNVLRNTLNPLKQSHWTKRVKKIIHKLYISYFSLYLPLKEVMN